MVARVERLALLGATAVFVAGASAMEPSDPLQTAGGMPVVHMWDCRMPDPTQPAAGFPVVHAAQHTEIYHATRETGAYSHHPRLICHGGRFLAMWSNHRYGEDGPGQRVLYAISQDGLMWEPWQELFPPPGPMLDSRDRGIASAAGGWFVIEGRLYGTASCWTNVGFENADRTKLVDAPDRDHPFRRRERHGSLAREVKPDGSLGRIFMVAASPPEGLAYRALPSDDPTVAATAGGLARARRGPRYPQGVDTNRLCEYRGYTARDGRAVVLARDDNYSHRMYVSVSEDGGQTWPEGLPTDIPDTPSLTDVVMLDDGTVLLIGNQAAPEFDNAGEVRHYNRDPLTVAVSKDGYLFTSVFALRAGAPPLRIDGVRGRGPGFQYPHAILVEADLWVIYSVGKEDVGITRVPLASLLGPGERE